MKNIKIMLTTVAAFSLLSACATPPDKINASYVSPQKYTAYNCDQISMEMTHISERVTDLYARLNKKSSDDAAQVGIGLFLFWPALFLVEGGDGPEASEYANLKGEYKALQVAADNQKCDPESLPKSPVTTIAKKEKKEVLPQKDFLSSPNNPGLGDYR